VRAPAPLTLQPKLAVGAPGDAYEQEAERVAERLSRMPEPTHPACACGGGCTGCQSKQLKQDIQHVQTQHVGATGSEQVEAPPSVHDVIASPGQPLDLATRSFFEPRFGRDFSRVRVHADADADQSARQVSANAYTVGHDIVFGAGRFAPHTAQGRHLLAHELTHVVQQSAAHRLQRDLGFEFQVKKNTITTNKGRTFARKAGKFFHKVPPGDKHGLELQTDTRSVMEFETHHFQKWSDLEAQIKSAVDVVQEIGKNPKAFPFNQETRFHREKLLEKGEKLEVDVKDSTFRADIQSTEAIALTQYQSLLKEHERTHFVDPVLKDAQDIINAASAASKSVKAGANLDNLRAFLQIIMNYVRRGQRVVSDKTDPQVVKAKFRLMMRVDFSSVFRSILSADEKKLFREIVKSDAIPKMVGIAGSAPFFKNGYWGDLGGGTHGFFEGGKVTAVAAADETVHDCSLKTKTKGVDSRRCGATIAGTDITVASWLKSIVAQPKDELSPPSQGSTSMGQFPVASKGSEKGLVVFETRGSQARNRTQPASKWLDYADEVFRQAAVCRARPGTGTELNYDGAKKFDPKKCT
jgi:hypothetical protein